ncbi:hypothetical protein RLB81_00380, partial [Streptococcus pneumoniae]|nr:hypothetical protein [Streptococcus pneumoniae]
KRNHPGSKLRQGFWMVFRLGVNNWGKWYFLKENGQLLVNGKTPEGYTVDSSGAWLVDVPIEKSATIKTTSHSEIKESKEVVKKDLENKETSQHESVTNSSTSQDLTSSTSQSSETSVNKSESEQ